jgi:hypothetical protein
MIEQSNAYLNERIAALEADLAAARDAKRIAEESEIRCAAELDEARADLAAARALLRQHAISHDPTKRPMRSTCNICEASWGGDDAESHGTGCPFYIDSALKGK